MSEPEKKPRKPPPKTRLAKALAERIDVHLKRFEADKKINAPDPKYKTRSYYYAHARGMGHRVFIVYISYQGHSMITIDEATAYLAWLDAGNVGRHYEQQKEAAKEAGL